MVIAANPTGPGPSYYKVSPEGNKLRIHDVHIPRGTAIFVPRGWDRSLREDLKIQQIVTPGADLSMIGKVFSYDKDGKESGDPSVIPLGNYVIRDRAEHVQAVVEIVPAVNNHGEIIPNELTVIERRMDTTGLQEDRSKYIYTLTAEGARKIEEEIIDINWIDDVRITPKNKVKITYTVETPTGRFTPAPLVLEAGDFHDNDNKPLLANPESHMGKTDDLYQSHLKNSDGVLRPFYTPETERFKPWIDEYNGNLRLIVHKVTRKPIKLPTDTELKIPTDGTVKIFPSAADAEVVLEGGERIPLTLKEPLKRLELIDKKLSRVLEGLIKSAIGPQTRFGEPDNISSEYPRDPYFYGFVFGLYRIIEQFGENFGVNRAKAIRAFRGIESGRTHVMPWKLLHNSLADVMETNSKFYKKLSNFAEELWGPGVSEDCQMEIGYWLKGIKMWVVKEMVALMPAEKEFGRYDKQNTQRYDYSEALFMLSFILAKCDLLEGRVLGKRPIMMNWAEMSEIAAGRTWYKWAIAKLPELASIPLYLMTLGHILCYPVDLYYFMAAWVFRTGASGVNYTRHLLSLGYGFITGFWKNPATELMLLKGYLKGAVRQFLDRNQYGTFVTTVSGTGEVIPKDYKSWIRNFATTTAISLVFTGASLGLGGLAFWLVLPLGIASLPVTLFMLRKGLKIKNNWLRRAAVLAAGLATAGGLFTIGLGTLALGNPLSIAVIANVLFGIYSGGLLYRAIYEMKRVTKAKEDPIYHKQMEEGKVTKAHLFSLYKIYESSFSIISRRGKVLTALNKLGFMDKLGRLQNKFDGNKTNFMTELAKNEFLNKLTQAQKDDIFQALDSQDKRVNEILDELTKIGYLDSENVIQSSFTTNRASFEQALPSNSTLQSLTEKERAALFNLFIQHRDFRSEYPKKFDIYQRIKNYLDPGTTTFKRDLSLQKLEATQTALKKILISINIMGSAGAIRQGDEHPYRLVAHELLETYKLLEMTICLQACRELRQNPASVAARSSLEKLLRETQERIVIDTAAKMIRRLNLRLERPVFERIKDWAKDMLK